MRHLFFLIFALLFALCALLSIIWQPLVWLFVPVSGLFLIGLHDMFQTRHTLWRNFPLFARGRWMMEFLRPFLRQYFFESETSGAPINRMYRSVIYQRAKNNTDSTPYGTKLDTNKVGYEWVGHSIAARHHESHHPAARISIGGPDCQQPYEASIFNVSGMSFGALSDRAIEALSEGAKLGNFYHNTGEGGVSPYHLKGGGDLVWQIGTGYFGCRNQDGSFSAQHFATTASNPQIKMIEIKLSQGAKPGHGGILPAEKNTAEIARIRLVEAGTQVDSPPAHSAFNTPLEMMQFIAQLRQLSGGKPIGFKLCIGRTSEFIALCKAMHESQIFPDFITVDGGEGGTGAAPLEYSNSVGMPLVEALAFVCDSLIGFNLRQHIRVIASGKVFTGFHLVKNLALGADLCNSARGMMVALGCVQSLLCNTNECPTGIATQKASLAKGLVVNNKSQRVASFHRKTVKAAMEIIASAGLTHTDQLNRSHIYRRISAAEVRRFDEIYRNLTPGALLSDELPDKFVQAMQESSSSRFFPDQFMLQTEQGIEQAQEVH